MITRTNAWAVLGIVCALGACSDATSSGVGDDTEDMRRHKHDAGAPPPDGGTTDGGAAEAGSADAGTDATSPPPTTVVPAARRIDWSQVGIPGGVPDSKAMQVCATVAAPSSGDAGAAIQRAIDACARGVVQLQAGTFNLSTQVSVRSNVVLKGAGPGKTILNYVSAPVGMGSSNIWNTVDCNGNGAYCSQRDYAPITAGFAKGSNVITVGSVVNGTSTTSTATIQAGDFLLIDQNNDPTSSAGGVYVDSTGNEGTCTYCGRANGARVLGQYVEVKAVSGSSVTIDPPLYWSYTGSLAPEASLVKRGLMTLNAGIEELTITQATTVAQYLVTMDAVSYSWIKHVEMEHPDWRCIWMLEGMRNVVRDSYFHDGINGFGRSHGYGVMLDAYETGTLVENNVLKTLNNFVMTAAGAAGNVIAYNYLTDTRYDDCETRTDGCWMTEAPSMNHGAHPHMNLWEGNYGEQFGSDFIHGSASHNTVYRNRSTGWQQPRVSTQVPWNYNAADLEYKNTFMNFVGNVMGTPGKTNTYELAYPASDSSEKLIVWHLGFGGPDTGFDANAATSAKSTLLRHGNWDSCSAGGTAQCPDAPATAVNGVVWDPAIAEHTLPASLYLGGAPSWWPSGTPFPTYGPDVSGSLTNKLPAQVCLETGFASCTLRP